jgi:hypothetical protein
LPCSGQFFHPKLNQTLVEATVDQRTAAANFQIDASEARQRFMNRIELPSRGMAVDQVMAEVPPVVDAEAGDD